MNLLHGYKDIQKEMKKVNNSLLRMKLCAKRKANKVIPVIDCESWRIVRIADETDNEKAKKKILNRIVLTLKNAFWF